VLPALGEADPRNLRFLWFGVIAMTAWYRAAFGSSYLTVYRKRDEKDARQLGVLLAAIGCRCRGRRVLDIGCGHGRHLRVLEEAGAEAYGIDLSRDLLAEAKRVSRERRIVLADMRALPFQAGSFHMALSLFTSFGYFDTDDENRRVLEETRRVLVPGGRLLIDYMNPARLRGFLAPETRQRVGSFEVLERRWIDKAAKRVNKRVEITPITDRSTRPERWTESVRLWTPAEFHDLLAQARFRVDRQMGDFEGTPFAEENSDRMILLCTSEEA
jgi:SAM-dependent methyltransferase